MERPAAEDFARHWIAAWNARDLPAILTHYAEDVIFHSPRITDVLGTPTPSVSGKAALADYWSRALALAPDLRFELTSVLLGSDALTILYRNHRAQDVAETLIFDPESRLVTLGIATYD